MTHPTFTIRPITKDRKPFHRTAVIIAFVAFNIFGVATVRTVRESVYGVEHVAAREALTFASQLPQKQIILPVAQQPQKQSGYWTWPGQPEYKNERLRAYQDLLRERGITDTDHLKLYVAQLLIENGALSEDVDGDAGCSIGIPQRNVCLFKDPVTKKRFTAKSFRERYPEWKEWTTQMNWMADVTAGTHKKFKENTFRAITSHNCPACARASVDACYAGGKRLSACYFQKVQAKSNSLTLL